MRLVCGIISVVLLLFLVAGFSRPSNTKVGITPAIQFIKSESEKFAASTLQLHVAISSIKQKDSNSIVNAREALKQCRVSYKKIEFFLEYFFPSAAGVYNMPAKVEVEEPYMEYQEPTGMQVIEAMLFEKDAAEKKSEILQQVDVVYTSAKDINALLYGFNGEDKQLLESIRLEVIRIITLGITGFDAPMLKSGIIEAEASLSAIQHVLQPFIKNGTKEGDSVSKYLSSSILFLRLNHEFDNFDRLTFLTGYALPLQHSFGQLVKGLKLDHNTTGGILNYNARDIFSREALNMEAFSKPGSDPGPSVLLGKKLFFETGLSGNNKISCATCHDPAKQFTDALPKSISFDGHSPLKRNAPSLLYAGFQHEQFWDGRATSLEEQIRAVLNNAEEMNGAISGIISTLKQKPEYQQLCNNAAPDIKDSTAILNRISASIAAFVRTLNPRNSKFDKYIDDARIGLTASEKNGFNLFMGKAQCGTCHFAPLFNGLVPPLYNLSELEVLGTPRTDDLSKAEPDADPGRAAIFPIEFYEMAFKTPTVRNVSVTGPYMHNGAFKTLEAVVEFYNKGGGNGLGLGLKNQTLSAAPLNLSNNEMSDIIAFLHTLEDGQDFLD
jgi:cytochrome c peroxidase